MKNKLLTHVLIMLISVVLGTLIVIYYWSASTFSEIKYLPMYMVVLSFGYVATQILKRYLINRQNWWDWLYYLGLLAIVLPAFFATESNAEGFHLITDYGSFFLVIPAVLDGISLSKQ